MTNPTIRKDVNDTMSEKTARELVQHLGIVAFNHGVFCERGDGKRPERNEERTKRAELEDTLTTTLEEARKDRDTAIGNLNHTCDEQNEVIADWKREEATIRAENLRLRAALRHAQSWMYWMARMDSFHDGAHKDTFNKDIADIRAALSTPTPTEGS